MNATTIDLTADIIDVRDIIARVEELEYTLNGEGCNTDAELNDAQNELNELTAILEDLKGRGGDEQWRGDWYPIELICDSCFVEYVVNMLDEIGAVPKNLPHYVEIDFERTADNIRTDYTPTEIDGVTYLYR